MATVDPVAVQPALLAPRNPLALPSLVLGVVAEVVGLAFGIGRSALLLSGALRTAQLIGLVGAVQSVVVGLIGLAALILGLVALVRRGRPRRAVAAAGTAIGAVIVFEVVTGLATNLLLAAVAG